MTEFDKAFPNDASRCANCGAPAYRHEMTNPPKEGYWTQRFDGDRYLKEKIAALTPTDCLAIWRTADRTKCGSDEFRAALLETLLGSSSEGPPQP